MPDFIEQYENDNAVLGEQAETETPLEQIQTLADFIAKHQISLTSRFVGVEKETRPASSYAPAKDYANLKWICSLERPSSIARTKEMPDIDFTQGAAFLEYRGTSKDWKRNQSLTLGYNKQGNLCGLWNHRNILDLRKVSSTADMQLQDGSRWVMIEAWGARTDMERAGIKWLDLAGLLLRPQAPTVETVLDCLASDASVYLNDSSFEEFASDFGYDLDSRKAEGIYKACIEIGRKLSRFLGRELLEELVYKVERL